MKALITTAAALCLLAAMPPLHAGNDPGARSDDDDANGADAASRKCLEFGTLSMVVQANVTDGDAEIFVTVIGQDDPLKSPICAGCSARSRRASTNSRPAVSRATASGAAPVSRT